MFYGLKGINFHRLTPKQVIAASGYLYKSLEIFRLLPEAYLHRLLGKSPIVQLEPASLLYEKDKESDYFSLILQGRVEVKSGTDNFVSENGPWSFLGVRALSNRKFVPDFSAQVIKETSFVKISREDFIEIVKQVSQEDNTFYLPQEMDWILNVVCHFLNLFSLFVEIEQNVVCIRQIKKSTVVESWIDHHQCITINARNK
jgi:hypothetical protein